MLNTIAIIISGIFLVILIYIQKPADAGITGAFLGAAGSDDSFNETKDIGVDRIVYVWTWIMLIIFIFFFTLQLWAPSWVPTT